MHQVARSWRLQLYKATVSTESIKPCGRRITTCQYFLTSLAQSAYSFLSVGRGTVGWIQGLRCKLNSSVPQHFDSDFEKLYAKCCEGRVGTSSHLAL